MVVSDQFVLCKAALIFAVVRWLLSFALSFLSSSVRQTSSCRSTSSTNLRVVRESLCLTTVGKIRHRLPESGDLCCAVCLNRMREKSQVWELSNCCHVFHKGCLEKWLAYDDRLTCPLCRASLVSENGLAAAERQPPSWAVERMLYLFGDDLLP